MATLAITAYKYVIRNREHFPDPRMYANLVSMCDGFVSIGNTVYVNVDQGRECVLDMYERALSSGKMDAELFREFVCIVTDDIIYKERFGTPSS